MAFLVQRQFKDFCFQDAEYFETLEEMDLKNTPMQIFSSIVPRPFRSEKDAQAFCDIFYHEFGGILYPTKADTNQWDVHGDAHYLKAWVLVNGQKLSKGTMCYQFKNSKNHLWYSEKTIDQKVEDILEEFFILGENQLYMYSDNLKKN